MKEFEFVSAAAKRAYLTLPTHIQKQFGTDLNAVQQGQDPFSSQARQKGGCAGVQGQTRQVNQAAGASTATSHLIFIGLPRLALTTLG
jgi:phage-related protein